MGVPPIEWTNQGSMTAVSEIPCEQLLIPARIAVDAKASSH